MASGKTTAGKKLASILGWTFADLDEIIEKREGRSIDNIFSDSGEEYFRRLETEALHYLDNPVKTVIATGGGAPCFSGNIGFMKNRGIVIYLKTGVEEIIKRLEGQQDTRPLVKNLSGEKLRKYIEQKLAERVQFYNQATITENGSDVDIQALAKKIKSILAERNQ